MLHMRQSRPGMREAAGFVLCEKTDIIYLSVRQRRTRERIKKAGAEICLMKHQLVRECSWMLCGGLIAGK